jgi:hypothetical protein
VEGKGRDTQTCNIVWNMERKGSELLDNQQRASRDDAKRNIFFLMLNCRSFSLQISNIPFNQIVVDKRY